MATTVFHSLTDVELLRAARASPLMNAPLFAELADRFETEVEGESLRELRFQQHVHKPKPVPALNAFTRENALRPALEVDPSCRPL